MLRRQRGATFLGMVIIVAILGVAVYGGIRLTPLYLEYFAVVRALEQTANEGSEGASVTSLRASLSRRWTIEDIKNVDYKDIEIKRNGTGFSMRAYYDAPAPFVANISLVATFDKTVDVN